MENSGKRLKFLRKSWGFTQKEMADYLGLAQGQIAKMENGSRSIRPEAVEKICLLFNINPEWFLYGEGSSNFKRAHIAKGTNLETISKMNKIIRNVEFLADITKDLE